MNFKACVSLFVLALAAGCGSTSASADGVTGNSDLTAAELPVRMTDFVANSFDQAVDHADATSGTFKQRFWYSTQFADGPNSPVIFNFCGEVECNEASITAHADTAKVLHAAVVSIEHRFYGKSLPFETPTLAQMKYLSIGAALDDAASFEGFAKDKLHLAGKWIAVGGSYAGMLAAFYRAKHPDLVVGAWASSAPIDVQESFSGYDQLAARALGADCTKQFRSALSVASTAFEDDAARDDLNQRAFNVKFPVATDLSADDRRFAKKKFLGQFSSVAFSAAQNGRTHMFCSALQQHADKPIDGLVGFLAPPLVSEADDTAPPAPAAAHPAVLPVVELLGPGDAEVAAADTPPPGGSKPAEAYTGGAWHYQQCTELGFFSIANPNREESVLDDVASDDSAALANCMATTKTTPAIDATRAAYLEPIKSGQVTNLYFVNGSLDPWSSLSFTSAAPAGVTTKVVALGSHCSDFVNLDKTSSVGIFEAHKQLFDFATNWLSQ